MRLPFCLILAGWGTRAVSGAGEPPLPAPMEPGRYASMGEQSPFALATAPTTPTAPKQSFAANWNITGLAKLPDAEGVLRDFVTIRSRDAHVAFSLFGEEVSDDEDTAGVSLASVQWNDAEPRKSLVMLKRGDETAKVEFGEETAPVAPPPGAAIPRVGVPGVRGPSVVQPAAPAMSGRPALPRPGPVAIPTLPGSNPTPLNGTPGTTSARKFRQISSKP